MRWWRWRWRRWRCTGVVAISVVRCTPAYAHNYQWFVELARNFHQIQTQMVRNIKFKISRKLIKIIIKHIPAGRKLKPCWFKHLVKLQPL